MNKQPHNNGMHPTPLHAASHARCLGARVMPGVGWLLIRPEATLAKRAMNLSFEALRKTLNVSLIRNAHLDVGGKPPEEISLGEIFGNMDALGYLILFLSLVVTMVVGFCSGMLISIIWPKPSLLYYLGVIPGVGAGFLTCYCMFRIRRR